MGPPLPTHGQLSSNGFLVFCENEQVHPHAECHLTTVFNGTSKSLSAVITQMPQLIDQLLILPRPEKAAGGLVIYIHCMRILYSCQT